MVVVDQALLETLPLKQRVKLCKQLRQEQVKQFNEWTHTETQTRERRPNKKGCRVDFTLAPRLMDATYRCDDREVLQLMELGPVPCFPNAMGMTLLHKCCIDDNVSVAELLLTQGVEVNAVDDDLWTPLHYACELDHSEIVQLLLSHGADVLSLDVDGNFPSDHAPPGSYSQLLVDTHLRNTGLERERLRELRLSVPQQMLGDVKLAMEQGHSLDTQSQTGITLLHIAAANSYREVVRLLLGAGAQPNIQDQDGWTPLHCAAKYSSVRVVKSLLRAGADPNLLTHQGQRASEVGRSTQVRELLAQVEERCSGRQQEEEEEEEDPVYTGMARINSKQMRPRHTTMSKSDQLAEGRVMFGQVEPPELTEEEEDAADYEDVQLSFANRTGAAKPEHVMSRAHDEYDGQGGYVGTEDKLQDVISTDDLASLAEMTEQNLLSELAQRYSTDRVYTYVGDVLIAVNPFKPLPIYSKNTSRSYSEAAAPLPPHIFGVAERALRGLLVEQKSQCCIISGESGAGKTESSKYFVQHLLSVTQSEESNLNIRIQQVNPLLEAFGNAQTVMNSNSSRFGKYLELHFSEEGLVLGARISEYLLEKSRVVSQAEGELNFHIFYLVFAGLSPDEYTKYGLDTIDTYRYLQASSLDSSQLVEKLSSENREQFRLLRDCLRFIGFSPTDLDNLLLSLSAVLHLGNIHFQPVGNNDAAHISNPQLLKKVAAMLQVPVGDLGDALVSEVTITRGERIRKERSVSQARDCCDALAKTLYGRLFSWIVNGINQLIQPCEGSGSSLEVGVLDIFGFENFPENSFEQLCINVANEQLQHYFSQHLFEQELEDCAKEGVSTLDLSLTSNKPTLDLFFKKPTGILSVLDEESRFPKATDTTLALKLHDGPGKEYGGRYLTPKHRGTEFAVMHYAGKVTYSLQGVLEKNRDTLPPSIMFTMKTSDSLLIKEMFQSKVTRTGSLAPSTRQQRSRKVSKKASKKGTKAAFDFFKMKKTLKTKKRDRKDRVERPVIGTERRGPATLAFHFKNSLAELMNKMNACRPHFVRCIKPNMCRGAGRFEREYVLAQLRYTGVHQTIRIRREGYALRLTPDEFINRYPVLMLCSRPRHASDITPAMDQCKQAFHYSQLSDYKIGKTKLFFRYWHVEKLAEVTQKLEAQALLVQRVLRGHAERRKFQRLQENKKRQAQFVETFLDCVSELAGRVYGLLQSTAVEDSSRHSSTVQVREKSGRPGNEDVRKSLEHLDQILDQYDESAFSEPPLPPPPPELLQNRPESLDTASSKEASGAVVPAPDYEDEQGPESGYITPDPTGSESEFPMFQQPLNAGGHPGYMAMRDVGGRAGGVGEEDAHRLLPEHSPQSPPASQPPDRSNSLTYTYQITQQVSISSQQPIQKDPSFRGGEQAYARTISPVYNDASVQQNSNGQAEAFQGRSAVPSQPAMKLIPEGEVKPLRKIEKPAPSTESPSDPHALPFKVQLKPVGAPKNSKTFGLEHQSKSSPSKAPVPLPKPRSPSPPLPPPPGHADDLAAADMDFPTPPPPTFSPPPPPKHITSLPPPGAPDLPPPPPCLSQTPAHEPPPPPPPFLPPAPLAPPPPPPPVVNAPPPPPPPAMNAPLPPPPPALTAAPAGVSQSAPQPPAARDKLPDLLSQLQNVTLTHTEKASKPSEGVPEAHNALITQIQSGIKLKPTPGGKKLTDSTAEENTELSPPQEAAGLRTESPTERKQSVSSNSSTSSASDSPSKVPPPTAPKSHKSPQNQGKMPSSKALDIFAEDLDITQLPGYQVVPEGCPGWKRAMIEKKNNQLLDEARRELLARKAEEEKWSGIPEWKRNLILEKERKKKEENEPLEAQRKKQQEEEQRLQNMPGWKKNLVLKKKD